MDAYTIGVDVGGTNIDAVLMKGTVVAAWHKTPTTANISNGVAIGIKEVLLKANVPGDLVPVVKVGTTQFINTTLERDGRKMDRVAVIRLCGPYTRSVAPFLAIEKSLRRLVGGHYAFIDGGNHVDGKPISPWSREQLQTQAKIIRDKKIYSIVLIGVNSPSFPQQEEEAAEFLCNELGADYDVSCSHHMGNSAFLERENSAILNAMIRRYARRIVQGLEGIIKGIAPKAKVFMTLNDGTISPAWHAAQYPLKCFFSGPTNSARGAAFMAAEYLAEQTEGDESADLLVVDVGGTSTDVISLLPNGYPKHSPAFVKIAGVKTNLAVPQTYSIALGGGSIIRTGAAGVRIGPDSVGAQESSLSLAAGGSIFTASDLAKLTPDKLNSLEVPAAVVQQAREQIKKMVESAVDMAKTKPIDANVILVGGGSFIIPQNGELNGVNKSVIPEYYQVMNAIGAAIAKISGSVNRIVIPGTQSLDSIVKAGKDEAIDLCCKSGGSRQTSEIVDLEIIPETYSFNGAFRLVVRAVSDFVDTFASVMDHDQPPCNLLKVGAFGVEEHDQMNFERRVVPDEDFDTSPLDISAYKPDIQDDVWTLTETDVDLLVDGTGVLGVGCTGEATNYVLALKEAMRNGLKVQIVPLRTIKEHDIICPTCWIGSPTAFFERLPGLIDMQEAIYANLGQCGKSDFTHTIPMESGGPNALEALLVAANLGKFVVDADIIGRAFPRIYMNIPGLHGEPLTPAAVSDGNGVIILLQNAKSDYQAEDILRSIAGQLGGIASLALRPFASHETHLFARNSYSLAWKIGYSMQLARQRKLDVATAIVSSVRGQILFRGKVNLVSRQVQSSFTRGTCTIMSVSEGGKVSNTWWLELIFENEILAAIFKSPGSERCLATTPDLMAIIESASGHVIGITELRYGLDVTIIALRAPEIWYSPEGLRRGGPAAFGLPEYQGSALEPTDDPISLFSNPDHVC